MNFVIEKFVLTDPQGGSNWSSPPTPHHLCEAAGNDAGAVLALVVAQEGGVQVGLSAVFTNGEALIVAQNGGALYALRAIPGS